MSVLDKAVEDAARAERKRRAKLIRNRTIRNPRFYLLIVVSVALLPVSLSVWLTSLMADWMKRSSDTVEQFFVRLLSPLNRWVDAGERKEDAA